MPEMESAIDPQVNTILQCLAPEEIDMLRDAFIFMDKDSDGFVNLEEMLTKVKSSVPAERFAPLCEYLTPLFLVADRDGDGKLSLTEFLMSFADGPGVVPADVVNSCVAAVRVRLTDEEISSLQENFRIMDVNGDGFLDADELQAALRQHLEPKFPDLTESQYGEIVTVILSSADADRDGKLCLSEFIRSFQEDQGVLPASFVDPNFASEDTNAHQLSPGTRELTEDEADVLREAFAVLDKNEDGYIDFVDLYNALWESLSNQVEDKTQIKDLCDLIMATADRRKRGRLSLPEFMLGFLRNMEVMQIPVAVAQEKVQSACGKLQQMYESGELERLVTVFEDLDSNGDGYIDRSEMVNVLISLFKDAFPEWDEETLNSVMAAIVIGAESHTSGRISLEEFIRSFVDGPGILPPEAVRVLDDRATASRSHHPRPSTASDDDLQRISDALRKLNEAADEDGNITEDELRSAIDAAFADQKESHPGKAEAMFHYVLNRFVNVLDSGLLSWNENVQIESDNGAEEPTVDPASPIPVPSAQEQEAAPGEGAVAEGSEQPVELPDHASGEEPPASEELPPTADGGATTTTTTTAAAAAAATGVDKGDSGDVCAAAPADADVVATAPATVERAVPSVLLSSSKKTASRASSSSKGAKTKQSMLLDSYKYGVTSASAADTESIFEDELRMLFKKYDTAKVGCLDRNQFKKVYCKMEHYGLEPSQVEVDQLFTKYAKGSDKIFFDEFCIFMLQRVQM